MPITTSSLAFFVLLGSLASAEDSQAVRKLFADPPREYSTGPLWTWNDLLTEEQVVTTLRELASQKVRQVWVHPQPGLMTPYLSADWFRLWKAALEEAKRLDVNIWMYDENSYPSGFAGGLVPEAMPESRGRGLHFREESRPGAPGPDVLGVFRLTESGAVNVTAEARSGTPPPERKEKYLTAVVVRAGNSPWFAGRCYVDLLYPGVTEKFLDITLEPYRRQFGAEFGKHILGVFMDEPHILPAGGLPWTDDLPQQFQKRWGYSLLDHLLSLVRPVGDWRRIRHNYFQVLLELFIERWGKPYFEYCERHGLELTGHYLEHEWPKLLVTPDFMALEAWEHRPGIDILLNQYQEQPHAQFGNLRIVKEIGSVANQLGRRRTLSETYAGSGHEIRFEEMKRQGDWQYALGLNTLNECLSHVSIRGVRKGNWPRTLSYHNPWWKAYHVLESYFTRLSVALSSGQQVNTVLVLEPTTTAWMYQNDRRVDQLGQQFQSLLVSLERAQIEYDLGSEDIIARHGSTGRAGLVVGKRRYPTIVLPVGTENLNTRTLELLESCVRAGATVLCAGSPPERIDGQVSARSQALAKLPGWKQLDAAALPAALLARRDDGFAVDRDAGDRGLLFHHRRRLDDGQLLFLVNTSLESPSRGTIRSPARGIEQWCPATGRTSPYRFTATGRGVEARFDVPPCGSLLLLLAQDAKPAAADKPPRVASIEPATPPQVRRLEDNVLVLNFLDLTTGGEVKKSVHCRQATRDLFKRNGFAGNPWFESVQFADEHLRRKFPPESRFEATYRFVIAESVPTRLQLVLERPDLYQSIECNGVAVSAIPHAWWLDRSFGTIDVRAAARVGENTVTVKASAFTVFHELEPAYVLGNFRLRAADSGFAIVPDSPLRLETLTMGHATQPNGTMWLSGGIGFRPDLPPARKDDTAPFLIFDLGAAVELQALRIWNYNEPNWSKLGVKRFAVTASDGSSPGQFPLALGTFELKPAPETDAVPADASFPQTFPLDGKRVRLVRFEILSNHNGVEFPTRDRSRYHAFVGLSEVQFLSADQQPLAGVSIQGASGELDIPGLCSRRAVNLIDGSGLLAEGWNAQGHPFYSAGVAYVEEFEVPTPAGRYSVELPQWLGSAAQVRVNGKEAGYIAWRPWECDVTDLIRPGRNQIEVVVIGTLRNTLGPHHAGPPQGAVTPHSFNQAPASGPPPGRQYSTMGYGLFQPFVLRNQSP
jgi:hypothetical protein